MVERLLGGILSRTNASLIPTNVAETSRKWVHTKNWYNIPKTVDSLKNTNKRALKFFDSMNTKQWNVKLSELSIDFWKNYDKFPGQI